MMNLVKSPLKWYGGKYYYAEWIVNLFPKHAIYVEPFAGALHVLFRKKKSNIEIVNDLSKELTDFWRVLQSEDYFAKFKRILDCTPHSEFEFNDATDKLESDDIVQRAAGFFIRLRQSFSGSGDTYTAQCVESCNGVCKNVSSWLGAIDRLNDAYERLRGVRIYNRDALRVIDEYDTSNTLFYLDPPYTHDSRTSSNDYDHEMSIEAHCNLLSRILKCKAKVMISGYPNKLYDNSLKGWRIHDKQSAIYYNRGVSGDVSARTERLWCNYE